MATTSKASLETELKTIFNDVSGKTADVKAEEIAAAIDTYIVDVISKISGTSTVTVASVTAVTPGGGVSGPGSGSGTIPTGGLTAN